jgi:O-antigen ligase
MLISWIIILCFVAYKIWIKKRYLKGGLVLIFLLGTVYFMADYIPTIKNKLSYFSWDIGKYKEKNYQTYSDGERIVSIMKGFEIARQNPAFGVGEGNLVLQMDSPTNKLPHNQFIVVWAQNGIFGLMSFIAVFVISFWLAFKKQNWLAFAYTLAMVVANMLEPMLETQLGLTIFSLPLLIVHSIKLYKEN